MKCKICNSETEYIFTEKVIFKYDVKYYKCVKCRFIQTETPYWLEEAYKDPVSIYDVGMAQRSVLWSSALERIINHSFERNSKFVDYGGGTGLLVRLMRDSGFNFYRYDPYSGNIFARGFDVSDLQNRNVKFELLTAFEVFEHLENPLSAVEEMFRLSDSILFSTLLQPSDETKVNPQDWAYFSQQTGQHISFYTKAALNLIALHFGCNLYSDGEEVHLLTFKRLKLTPTKLKRLVSPTRIERIHNFFVGLNKPTENISSYTKADYEFINNSHQKNLQAE
jgi:hypothetical protein